MRRGDDARLVWKYVSLIERPFPTDPQHAELALTGERTLPGIPDENYWFQRHVVAYRIAGGRAAGRTILDAGCGEGYGLAMLRDAGALRVIGADLDEQVVSHVRDRYAKDGVVEAVQCELMALPLADDEVDMTVSFQVIEHLHDIPGYLRSLRRVTRPDGEVLIATPNRLTFTPDSDVPVNPFHTKEFTASELTEELEAAGLAVTSMLGIHHGVRLRAVERAVRRPFTTLITSSAPSEWSRALRAVVHRVTPDDFRVSTDDLDDSLDLLAFCRVRS